MNLSVLSNITNDTDGCNCYLNGSKNPVPGIGTADLEYFVGLLLAVSSSLFIGASFIIKKKSLIRLAQREGQRASDGGLGYLSDWLWWAGFFSLALGEGFNFAAYAFVPASLVTPLRALSVLVTAILASYFLEEKLSLLAKLSCALCLLGSTVTVLHAPAEGLVQTLDELEMYITQPAFVTYLLLVISISTVMIFYCAPIYGQKNIFVYIIICSLVGSLSVMAVKGVGIALINTITGKVNEFKNAMTYICLANLIVCVSIQMNYLNKALDTFNTSVVSPIYYVFFTIFVMIASGILYGEFSHMTWFNILGLVSGFSTIIIAVFMLYLFKDLEISLTDVSYVLGPQNQSSEPMGPVRSNSCAEGFDGEGPEGEEEQLLPGRSQQAVARTGSHLSGDESILFAREKWKKKRTRKVSFYGSISDSQA